MRFRAVTTTIAWCLACAASQSVAQETDEQIVVSGEALEEPGAVRDLVQEMAADHGPDVPLARFFDRLCISVSGLNQVGNDYLANRIVENSRAAGLEASSECRRANALVLIYGEPAALVDRIVDEQPQLLPAQQLGPVRRAIERGEQVLVWHNDEVRSRTGRRMAHTSQIVGHDGGSDEALSTNTRIENDNWPSRIDHGTARGIVSAAIIFDGDIAAGMEIDRLADYATMRLLAPGLVPLETDASTSLSVTAPFPVEGGPSTLTKFDTAYLRALYSLPANSPAIRLPRAVARAYLGED